MHRIMLIAIGLLLLCSCENRLTPVVDKEELLIDRLIGEQQYMGEIAIYVTESMGEYICILTTTQFTNGSADDLRPGRNIVYSATQAGWMDDLYGFRHPIFFADTVTIEWDK